MPPYITAGVLVIIQNFYPNYDGCVGTVKYIEQGMLLLTDVYCPKGPKLDYIVGVPFSKVSCVSCGNRPGDRK